MLFCLNLVLYLLTVHPLHKSGLGCSLQGFGYSVLRGLVVGLCAFPIWVYVYLLLILYMFRSAFVFVYCLSFTCLDLGSLFAHCSSSLHVCLLLILVCSYCFSSNWIYVVDKVSFDLHCGWNPCPVVHRRRLGFDFVNFNYVYLYFCPVGSDRFSLFVIFV